ncbi:MAG: glutamine amidotransferase [Clostridia bacterium]|nr:glutamine amidotransferase [Clostridia bacterium]
MDELKICYLYPDILNLFSDSGNITCIKKRLEWRGIKADITEIPVGESLNVSDYDLFFIGGGQEFEHGFNIPDFADKKAKEIKKAVDDEKVFLAIGTGYQLLGNYCKAVDGTQYDMSGAVNFHTIAREERFIGNYCFESEELGGLKIVGFENHAGKTYLSDGVKPLGKVLKGYGNNGEDFTEGARYKNVFASYSHGSLLPKNPVLADYIIKTALERKYNKEFELSQLDDTFELNANKAMLDRLLG